MRTPSLKFRLSLAALVWTSVSGLAHAAPPLTMSIEPIIGYERVQKLVPTAHTTSRLLYGARLTAGIPLVAAEAQYTRGNDTEEFPDQSLTIKDMDEKLKLGLRSSIRMTSLFSLQARGGGQAKRNTHEVNGLATVNPITYQPYAGLGLQSRLGRNFVLEGGVTTVFNDFPHMSQNEYETTLGFSILFP